MNLPNDKTIPLRGEIALLNARIVFLQELVDAQYEKVMQKLDVILSSKRQPPKLFDDGTGE